MVKTNNAATKNLNIFLAIKNRIGCIKHIDLKLFDLTGSNLFKKL